MNLKILFSFSFIIYYLNFSFSKKTYYPDLKWSIIFLTSKFDSEIKSKMEKVQKIEENYGFLVKLIYFNSKQLKYDLKDLFFLLLNLIFLKI